MGTNSSVVTTYTTSRTLQEPNSSSSPSINSQCAVTAQWLHVTLVENKDHLTSGTDSAHTGAGRLHSIVYCTQSTGWSTLSDRIKWNTVLSIFNTVKHYTHSIIKCHLTGKKFSIISSHKQNFLKKTSSFTWTSKCYDSESDWTHPDSGQR